MVVLAKASKVNSAEAQMSDKDEVQKTELKPFHESIVDILNCITTDGDVYTSARQMLRSFAVIIKSTKIPKNHDAIILAWEAKWQLYGLPQQELGVVESLMAQKQEVEAPIKRAEEAAAAYRAEEEIPF